MRISLPYLLVTPLLVAASNPATAQSSLTEARRAAQQAYRRAMTEARELYKGRRGPEQTDTFSRKVRIGRDGRVSISNVSGTITVTAASGDEVSIDAVKRARGDRSQLGRVNVIVEEHPGRVDVRTEYGGPGFPDRLFRDDFVSVDYTVVVPSGVSLDEEADAMMRFQRAYEANARYFQTVSGLLDTLIGLLQR